MFLCAKANEGEVIVVVQFFNHGSRLVHHLCHLGSVLNAQGVFQRGFDWDTFMVDDDKSNNSLVGHYPFDSFLHFVACHFDTE